MTSAELRTFYLTGKGLDAYRPAVPLRSLAAGEIDASVLARPLSFHDVVELAAAAVEKERRDARASLLAELREHAQRLEETLAVDDSKSAAAKPPETLAASLGARAWSLVNPSALAQALHRRVNATHAMDAERRVRCEAALSELEDAIAALQDEPPVLVVQYGDVCKSALEACVKQSSRCVQASRALRIARLELESAFEPAYHPAILDEFEWTMAHPREIAAMPAVLVAGTAPEIANDLTSFAQLLRSGFAVQILVDCPHGLDEDLGALPLAYPDAFSLSASVAAPEQLTAGLAEMARTLKPAVGMIATSDNAAEAALLIQAHAWPLYRYNPDSGETWRERFTLDARADGRLSLAQAAAAIPAFRDSFRVIDATESGWNGLPSFPVHGANDAPSTAVYTRELAALSAKAERRYRLFAELAAPAAKTQIDADSETRARAAGAADAIQRALALLAAPEAV